MTKAWGLVWWVGLAEISQYILVRAAASHDAAVHVLDFDWLWHQLSMHLLLVQSEKADA